VTGAGSEHGIGYACARLLAAAGAEVVLTATSGRVHERAATLADLGYQVHSQVADLTVADEVAALVAACAERVGRIDVLVNNAGMTSVSQPGESGDWRSTDLGTWQASLDRNLTTAFALSRQLLGPMTDKDWGRVVNVASVTGPLVAYPGDVAYAAAKAGMIGLTRALAVEVGPRGVTVNAVLPGWIDTGSATDAERAAGSATPVGRPGTPDEVAAAVLVLASVEAGYLTGTTLVVDGGNSVQEIKG
jgi:3-oxoacyl-[acyl-carrier protein] reductase